MAAKRRKKRGRRSRGRGLRWFLFLVLLAGAGAGYWWYTQAVRYGIHGIDVSRYQGSIQWDLVHEDGITFAFIKATEGSDLVDTRFKANWDGARQAGVVRGAYHFYRPSVDPHVQAQLFLKQVQLRKGDLPPVLDLEVTDGKSRKEIREGALIWLEEVEKAMGVRPILYTMPRFAEDYLDERFAVYPLWVVDLRALKPRMPSHWQRWEFWQFSHTGRVKGIREKVDLNRFYGSWGQLDSLRLR